MSRSYLSKGGRAKKIDFDDRQKRRFAVMAREGYEVRDIAQSVGCSTQTLNKYAETAGVEFTGEASVRRKAAEARKKATEDATP